MEKKEKNRKEKKGKRKEKKGKRKAQFVSPKLFHFDFVFLEVVKVYKLRLISKQKVSLK